MPSQKISADDEQVYGVRSLVGELREELEGGYSDIWVRGEISSLASPPSGHLYFSLKEDDAVIRCALFSNRRRGFNCKPHDGMLALVRARVSIYEARGDLQLIVSYLEDAGEGALRREFERVKRKLEKEGLFAQIHKRALPAMPKVIGVITSAAGAALHDVRVTLRRRWPAARLVVYPSAVQGAGAVANVVEMISRANRRRDADVLIVARGGGSFEDLQAFNSEEVARAIFKSELPLISAVGHEIDFTLADFAADMRAPTPTAAAEMVAPSASQISAEIGERRGALCRQVQRRIDGMRQRADHATARLIHPARRLDAARQNRRALQDAIGHLINARLNARRLRLQQCGAALQRCSPRLAIFDARRRLGDARKSLHSAANLNLRAQRVEHLAQKLQLLGPTQTLGRGYAILQARRGEVITDAAATRRGQILNARVARGSFECAVGKIISDDKD